MSEKTLSPYKILTNLGIEFASSNTEKKKVRMVNMLCLLWYHAFILTSILSYSMRDDYAPSLIINACGFLWIIGCQVFNKYGKFTTSAFCVLIYTIFHYFIISCFAAPGKFAEFFYLFVPCISLIFFNKLWYSWLILGLSIVMFHVPFLVFGYYDKEGIVFVPPLMIFLFVVNFMIVLYFRNLNNKNEDLLQEEKNKVLSDKQTIEAQNNQLEELNDFKNKFFINISHELRTPLTLIDGFASQLEKEEQHSEFSGKILEQSGKMKQIVSDILDLSKLRSQKLSLTKRSIDLHSFLSKLYRSFLTSFQEKGIEFNLKLSPKNIMINADLIYLERSLNNLLLNSLKFTAVGNVTIESKFKNGAVQVIVSDTGIGIRKEELPHIFTEFYQVNNDINQASGSGIGLSFSKNIIELHDGKLEVESEFGYGTSFIISFDAIENSEVSIPEPIHHEDYSNLKKSQTRTRQEKILVVEDHKEMRMYLDSILCDYQIIEAENGVEALEVLKNESVDFIITDYMMPKMNGYDFIRSIKKYGYEVPVLMLTARADVEAKIDVLRLGIDDYMTKPFNEEELLVRIENALNNSEERSAFIQEVNEEEVVENESAFIKLLHEYISEHSHKNQFSLEDIKEEFALSTSTLYRKVKLETGMSPNELVREIRLQTARELIEDKKVDSIKSLSISVGFKNTTYFAKQYEARFGTMLNTVF